MLTTDQILTIARTFQGSAQQIYRAWTEIELLAKWCYPSDTELVEATADARVGGKWTCSFRMGDGRVHSEYGEFLELSPFHRIVQTLNNMGGFIENTLVQTVITITITELGSGRTEMTFSQTGIPTQELRNGLDEGWSDIFGRIDGLLASWLEE